MSSSELMQYSEVTVGHNRPENNSKGGDPSNGPTMAPTSQNSILATTVQSQGALLTILHEDVGTQRTLLTTLHEDVGTQRTLLTALHESVGELMRLLGGKGAQRNPDLGTSQVILRPRIVDFVTPEAIRHSGAPTSFSSGDGDLVTWDGGSEDLETPIRNPQELGNSEDQPVVVHSVEGPEFGPSKWGSVQMQCPFRFSYNFLN
jgi:hypothetical protein